MYILKAISEDGYAEVIDSTTNNLTVIEPLTLSMLRAQHMISQSDIIEKMEFMLGVYENGILYLIARHRDELTTTIANAYSTRKYVTAIEKCNAMNALFMQSGYTYVCSVIPKSRAKIILNLNRDQRKGRK